MSTNLWIKYRTPSPQACLRLFCLPYAGGGASIFRSWSDTLSPMVDVVPIQLPGREERLKEDPFKDLLSLADVLAEVLKPYLDIPFAVFGHSMGALIGYELVQRIKQKYKKEPKQLIVSAFPPPHTIKKGSAINQLPDFELIEKLKELNGIPNEILNSPEAISLFASILRADISMVETYIYNPNEKLSCPIFVFGGTGDKEILTEQLRLWKEYTSGNFKLQLFSGDHFFLNSLRANVLAAISQYLLDL
ncbi:MAG TPA: thioesterase domain-containing protein [Ruminiclostridium sp.]|nr:thioesterase domain-containing protein [Ruminiclostridium sp.]